MEVTYTLTPKHFAHFQRFWYAKRARLKLWMRAALLLLLVALLVSLFSFSPLVPFQTALVPFLFFFAFLLGLPFLLPLNAATYAKRVPDFLGLHTMRIAPEGLIGKSGGTETRREWRVVQEIVDDGQMLYFFLSPRYAVLLPKDVFDTPAHAQRFADAARFFWQHPGEPLPPGHAETDTWPPPPSVLRPL